MGLFQKIGQSLGLNKGIHDADWSGMTSRGGISLEGITGRDTTLTAEQTYRLTTMVYAAVNAIARNISKAKLRLFTDDGEEVLGGELYELFRRPCPHLSQMQWLQELAMWLNIEGEFAAKQEIEPGSGKVRSIYPLNPKFLAIEKPTNPKRRTDVVQWRYNWTDGTLDYIRDDYLLHLAFFNPRDPIRGLSPTEPGGTLIATAHHAVSYNKSFFENYAIPSHIVVLPEGTPRQQREDFEQRYLSMYQGYRSAFKAMVVSGKGVDVKQLEQPFQDGQYMEWLRWATMQVGMIYKVPAIEFGIYDKTRFDTANDERKLFVESTLMPQMQLFSEVLQAQVVDSHFQYSDTAERSKAKLSKSMAKAYEQARENNRSSRLIVLLDPDSLPIMNEVNLSKVAQAEGLRNVLMMSPTEAAEYVGLDIPHQKERDDIWNDKKYINITDPAMNQKLQPKPEPKPAAGAKKPAPKKELTSEQRQLVKDSKLALHKLRKLTFESLEQGGLWGLEQADAVMPKELHRATRIIRHKLRTIIESFEDADGRKGELKFYLNSLDAKKLLGL
jgi:HK97 family phage portal protein